jgi:hypothetical protein
LPSAVEHPSPEDELVELQVLESEFVVLWVGEELLFLELLVEDGEPDDGDGGEEDVVELVEHGVVHGRAREEGESAEVEYRQHEYHIYKKYK